MSVRVAVAFVTTGVLLAGSLSPIAAQKSPGQSDKHASDFAISVRAGTLGGGVELSKLLVSHVGLRVGVNYFTLKDHGQKLGDNAFDLTVDFRAITALLDLYPGARGSFHLTGGLITAPVKISGPAQSGTTSYKINDRTYTSSQVGTLTVAGKFASAEPYLGIGFGTAASKHGGLGFVFDLGVAIGKPTLSLTSTSAATNTQLQSDLNAEVAKRQSDADKVPGWPVLAFGLMFRF